MELRIVKVIALVALWMGMAVGLHAQTVVEYIHTDALGTPVAVTNAAGTVIERSVYEPYGQLINRPLTDGPGFTGHVQDAATGLTYMEQRYYDPMIGRFLSIDPVTADSVTGANFNRYWYANNNPYKFTDPDGRQALCSGSQAKRCIAVLDMDDLGTAPASRNHQAQNGRSKTTDPTVPSALPSPQVQSGSSESSAWDDLSRSQCGGNCWEAIEHDILLALPGENSAYAGIMAIRLTKAINLPGWSRVSVDMAHIAERHMAGGALTGGKSVFVGHNMQGVMAAIKQAYGSAAVVRQQGDRVLLSGMTKTGMQVEMWLNKATNVIETAYPVVGR